MPRLARYVMGVDDDTIMAAVQRLRQLYAEVSRREAQPRLAGRGEGQAAARKSPPTATCGLFSECHELFGHDEYGELAAKTAKRARKTGITLFDTQSSRASQVVGAHAAAQSGMSDAGLTVPV